MRRVTGILLLASLYSCSAQKEHLKPEPVELARYKYLTPRRLYFEQFRAAKLLTVPGNITAETRKPEESEPPFVPTPECGDEFRNLTAGSFGTITSPNYPRRYLPELQCEWVLESVPGTVIEITLFDSVTQPWLITYFDYLKISLDGNWTQFRRFAGDVNYKTPYTLISKENQIGIRFITSRWLNFRGFSLFYVVRNRNKSDKSPQTNEFGSVLNNNVVAVCNRKPTLPLRKNDKYPQEQALKIINGEVTVPHQYPFSVALLIDGRYFCAGTLIDDVNVLTAAHCVEGADRIVLIFGLHNMTNPAERYYSRQIRLVEYPDTANHVHIHPHFNPETGANDIAIVRVPQKVKFTGYVQPIYLPSIFSASNVFYNKELKTVGWGQYDINSDGISTVLREGPARVISNGDCREEFEGAITGNNICTMTPYIPPQEQPTEAPTDAPSFLRRIVRQSNVTNEQPEQESEATQEPEAETLPPPNYVSPCLGDAGGPLFTEFQESEEGSKDSVKQECVEAKPNGSGDEDDSTKSGLACDRPKELARKWYVLVGVVSFGTRVCGEEVPVAYTRVSGYLEWIAYVTGRHG